MEEIFKSFCAFGSGNTPQKGSIRPTMGNAKFAKFSRDMKLLDRRVTSTDFDIIFSKVKKKNEQKISYGEFIKALHLVAEKKYPDDDEAYVKLEKHIMEGGGGGGGPKTTKTTKPARTDVIDRLTDVRKYTGSHKERFDMSGKGKGMKGRYEAINTDGYTQGYKNMNTYAQTHKY